MVAQGPRSRSAAEAACRHPAASSPRRGAGPGRDREGDRRRPGPGRLRRPPHLPFPQPPADGRRHQAGPHRGALAAAHLGDADDDPSDPHRRRGLVAAAVRAGDREVVAAPAGAARDARRRSRRRPSRDRARRSSDEGPMTRPRRAERVAPAGIELNQPDRHAHASAWRSSPASPASAPTAGAAPAWSGARTGSASCRLSIVTRRWRSWPAATCGAFGPATDRDFAYWAGLPLGTCARGWRRSRRRSRRCGSARRRCSRRAAALPGCRGRARCACSATSTPTCSAGRTARFSVAGEHALHVKEGGGGWIRPVIVEDGSWSAAGAPRERAAGSRSRSTCRGPSASGSARAIEAEVADIARFEGMEATSPDSRVARLPGRPRIASAPMSDEKHELITDQAEREASGAHAYGRYLEEFEVGAIYKHWPAKTITEPRTTLLPADDEPPPAAHQRRLRGPVAAGKNVVAGPYVYSLVFGMTVNDVSGKAIANLATDELSHPEPGLPRRHPVRRVRGARGPALEVEARPRRGQGPHPRLQPGRDTGGRVQAGGSGPAQEPRKGGDDGQLQTTHRPGQEGQSTSAAAPTPSRRMPRSCGASPRARAASRTRRRPPARRSRTRALPASTPASRADRLVRLVRRVRRRA